VPSFKFDAVPVVLRKFYEVFNKNGLLDKRRVCDPSNPSGAPIDMSLISLEFDITLAVI
jgi:hypothetical protein